jgi:hypothetical protein
MWIQRRDDSDEIPTEHPQTYHAKCITWAFVGVVRRQASNSKHPHVKSVELRLGTCGPVPYKTACGRWSF